MTNKKPNAKTPDNIFTSGINQLYPKQKTQYEPKADNNILKVEEQCLYALSAADRENTGRTSGAWWFIWMTIFMIELYIVFMLPSLLDGSSVETLEEQIFYIGGGMLIFILGSLPFYIRWRRVLPVCFNRENKIVGTWHKGQLWTAHWDTIEAHSKTLTLPAPIPYKLGVVGVNLYPPKNAKNQESITTPIAGTETHSMTPQEASGMAWEYIRTFMEKGKQALPEIAPLNKVKTSSIKDVLIENNPFPKNPSDPGPFIFGLVLLPIAIPFALVSIPTDFIFMGLDKILPQRKMPKPLRGLSQAGS